MLVSVAGVLDELRTEERHDRHGHDIGAEKRDHNGKCKRCEQVFADACEQNNWKEHDRRAEGGSEHRKLHLFATFL